MTIHTAGRMYRQTGHWYTAKVRVRVSVRVRPLGLEFSHGQACASLLIFFIHMSGRVYNISRKKLDVGLLVVTI